MMKKILFSLFLLIGVTVAMGQTLPTEDPAKIEASHDFGVIPQGKPATYAFVLTNQSNKPFELEHVSASCGCTTPEWTKGVIPPGGKTTITVGYNAAAEGKFEKTVTLAYNNGQTKTVVIKGVVEKAQPSAAYNASVQLLKQSHQSQNR